MTTYYCRMKSPVDDLLLVGNDSSVTGIYFVDHKRGPTVGADWRHAPEHVPCKVAMQQLEEYFAGQRRLFDFAMSPSGTELQQQVWRELARIPFGETVTYTELARRIGRPTAVRAVASAVARNPLSIVVPCHRVIGASGSLTGFAGGVARKRILLEHERRLVSAQTELIAKRNS